MTTQRWLNLAAAIVALLILLVAAAAWRTRPGRELSAEEIRARAATQMQRIEARAAELERNAAQ